MIGKRPSPRAEHADLLGSEQLSAVCAAFLVPSYLLHSPSLFASRTFWYLSLTTFVPLLRTCRGGTLVHRWGIRHLVEDRDCCCCQAVIGLFLLLVLLRCRLLEDFPLVFRDGLRYCPSIITPSGTIRHPSTFHVRGSATMCWPFAFARYAFGEAPFLRPS